MSRSVRENLMAAEAVLEHPPGQRVGSLRALRKNNFGIDWPQNPQDLGISRVRLMTNSPAIARGSRTRTSGIERMPVTTSPNRDNEEYLRAKPRSSDCSGACSISK